jgi:hypothetical protein
MANLLSTKCHFVENRAKRCFKGRRKCDRAYPVCERCQKNNKTCRYAYPQLKIRDDTFDVIGGVVNQPVIGAAFNDWISCSPVQFLQQERDECDVDLNFARNESALMEDLLSPSIPNFVGTLGELQPVSVNTKR